MKTFAVSWLPAGKKCAVCFTVDDVHPGRSTDAFEAGGDLENGALGHISWLLARHAQLRCTLFVTADWRQVRPKSHRPFIQHLPWVGGRMYHSRPLPRGTMRLDRHPEFIQYLRSLPRTDVALHGLHHLRTGPEPLVEFADRSQRQCERILRKSIRIFERAGLPFSAGLCPPVWHFSPQLGSAMATHHLRWVASARDLETAITPGALTAGSGLRGAALTRPHRLHGSGLLHFPTNFQATSTLDRAFSILDGGGLLSIKAHISKHLPGHTLLDGMDETYRAYLDTLFSTIARRYGSTLWWTSMNGIAAHMDQAEGAGRPGDKLSAPQHFNDPGLFDELGPFIGRGNVGRSGGVLQHVS